MSSIAQKKIIKNKRIKKNEKNASKLAQNCVFMDFRMMYWFRYYSSLTSPFQSWLNFNWLFWHVQYWLWPPPLLQLWIGFTRWRTARAFVYLSSWTQPFWQPCFSRGVGYWHHSLQLIPSRDYIVWWNRVIRIYNTSIPHDK